MEDLSKKMWHRRARIEMIKALVHDPEWVVDFLEGMFTPEYMHESYDLSEMKLVPISYLSSKQAECLSDVIWEAQMKGVDLKFRFSFIIYRVVTDEDMPFEFNAYMFQVFAKQLKMKEKGGPVFPLPIV